MAKLGWAPPGTSHTASTTHAGSTTRPAAATSSSTISSTVTMERRAASTASFWTPTRPQIWTLPWRSACWAWMIATSGLSAGTAVSCSPVNGQSIGASVGVWSIRSVPT